MGIKWKICSLALGTILCMSSFGMDTIYAESQRDGDIIWELLDEENDDYDEDNVDFSDWADVIEIYAYGDVILGLTSEGTVLETSFYDDADLPDVKSFKKIVELFPEDQALYGLTSDEGLIAVGEEYYGRFDVEYWQDIVDMFSTSVCTIGVQSDGELIITDDDKDKNKVKQYIDGDLYYMTEDEMEDLYEEYEDFVDAYNDDIDDVDVDSITDYILSDSGLITLYDDGTVQYEKVRNTGTSINYSYYLKKWSDIVQVASVGESIFGLTDSGKMVYIDTSDINFDCSELDSWTNVTKFYVNQNTIIGIDEDGNTLVVSNDTAYAEKMDTLTHVTDLVADLKYYVQMTDTAAEDFEVVSEDTSTENSSSETELLYETEAQALHDLGIFDGVSSAEFDPNLEGTTNREQALKMIGDALQWDIDSEAVSEFDDVSSWAQPYVAKAVELGITNGVSESEFNGTGEVSGKAVCTWILRALGVDLEDAWNATDTYLDTFGLDVDASQSTTYDRNLLVHAIYESLTLTPIDSETSLVETIVGDDEALLKVAEGYGLITEEE